ncbi:MAG: restriction endonuclease subunit S [Pseudomonadota bacterium]
MKGWLKTELGAVASVSAGNSAPQDPRLFVDGNFPFFRTSDVGRIRVGDIEAAVDNLNDEGVRGLRLFQKGTILFPKSGASTFLNHRVMMAVDGYVSSHLATIVSNPTYVDSRFLLYFLTTIRAQEMVQDHAYPSLNLPLIASIKVPLPTIDEQRRIAATLDEAFEGIVTAKVNAEKNLKNARELFESRREELFSRSKADWINRSLSDICDIKHGYAFEGEFFAASGDHVLLTPGNFFEAGGYRDRGEKQKYFIGPIPSGYILKKDDLLLAMTEQAAGLLGSPLLVPESGRFLHNQRLGLVQPREGVAWSNEFFFHVFNLKRVRSEIHASASGVKVRHTSPSKIGAVSVDFPVELKTQRRIASSMIDFWEECDRLAAIFESKLAALDELKKALLHQAFTGQL